ncbi:delta(14)-sterol reductase LBR isoform X1 [Cyprinodon tularosa]|uniref:delta(14)-sterol reductase LBR isoform X1 n=1 Tax=Cyprinodon tularosa TaxID=77115 RepID=UPI0018E1E9E2|nr:delta(14)-sterol reductase LBR isoform X1 [Cyprinodon tularosa]XP_038134027.1 delta(14)-sterol reductase LBR isoform X1 [Cyprinodon tularosa]
MPSLKYQPGEKVMGRWPGSSLYYEVKVLGFDSKSRLYTVIYKDGTELELKEQDIISYLSFQARTRSRSNSRSPGRRRSRSRSPARTTRRSSSRTAAAASAAITESAPSSHGDAKLKRAPEVKLSPLPQEKKPTENSSNNKHEKKEENNTASKEIQPDAKAEADPEKNLGRYNLRRRKDDGEAKAAEAKTEQQVKEAKPSAALAVTGPTPASPRLDFGGKIGAFFWTLFLPAWVLFLLLQVNRKDPSLANFPPPLPPLQSFWDPQALGFVVLWILFQALLYVLPVGKLSEGVLLRSGRRLKYRTNGFFAVLVSAAVVAAAVYQGADLTYIHSHFLQLTTASFLIAMLLSIYLYVRSRSTSPDERALGGNSGNMIYDFFKGRELNPRIKEFDLKFFCEMRPGLIGWCLINFAMALAEMKQQKLDAPSSSMILVNVFQLLYVVDGLWNEEAILTTMDLMHDGFGYMLAFGDLVWVPFTYTLQAHYLVSHPNPLSLPVLSAIVILKLVGFYIFRKSNSEKNAFRRNPSDPSLSHLKTIPTATGKSLLVSGWWGVVRHPNYLGDLIMALAWSLPCGFSHILPWFYMIYFIILLVHRDSRDMNECRRKYGSAWDEYCRTVRYRIIPRVY